MNDAIERRGASGAAVILFCTALLRAPAAVAADQPAEMLPKATLTEVIVTARKRKENAEQVPISMSVVSGRSLLSQGVSNIETLSPAVPDFNYTQTIAGADQMFIRGIGAGVNAGYETAVGTVVDGFFYGRSRFDRLAFLDVGQVVVLRGPQGALIGKNTLAGAVDITANEPTRSLHAYLDAAREVSGNPGYSLDGAVSGPLGRRLQGRVAFSYDNKSGWVRNLLTGHMEPKTDDFDQRTTLDFEPTEALLLRLSYQYANMNDPGRNVVLSKCSPGLKAVFAADGLSSLQHCTLDYTRSAGVINANGVPQEDHHHTAFNIVDLTAKWRREAFVLTSLTGYAGYNAFDAWDADSMAINALGYDWGEKYYQWTEELRLGSRRGYFRHFDYIAGVYLGRDHQQDNQQLDFYPALLPPPLVGSRNLLETQITHNAAAFGQVNLYLTPQWTLTVGARYTYEKKRLDAREFPTRLNTSVPIVLPAGPAAFRFDVQHGYSASNFSPNASLQWKPNGNTMLYANVSRGFQGGGFDLQFAGNQAAAANGMKFAGETATQYEFGSKLVFAGDRARLNVDAFREDIQDVQVSSLLNAANLTFAVSNAAAARTQGFEADLRYRPVRGLTLSASGSYLDAKFTRFSGAQCYDGQTAAQGCVGGSQNLSGHPLQFAPKWSGTFNGDYVTLLGSDYALDVNGQVVYKSRQFLALTNDPNLVQPAYAKVNASIALSDESSFWTVALVGRNLTNKVTAAFGNTSDAIGGPGSYFEFIDPPREISVQVRLKY